MSWQKPFRPRAPKAAEETSPVRRRLAESFVRLQNIELVRVEEDDPNYAKTIEDRIVWRELIELELQEIDERIAKISGRP